MPVVSPRELAEAVVRLLHEDADFRRAGVGYDPGSVSYRNGILTVGLLVECVERTRPAGRGERGDVEYEVECIWRDGGLASSIREAQRAMSEIKLGQAEDLCEFAIDILDGSVLEVGDREYAVAVESAREIVALDSIRCVMELRLSEE